MQRLQYYLLYGGLIALLYWSPVRDFLQSPAFMNTVLWIIGGLWGLVIIVTFPAIKRKWKERRNKDSNDKEGV